MNCAIQRPLDLAFPGPLEELEPLRPEKEPTPVSHRRAQTDVDVRMSIGASRSPMEMDDVHALRVP